MADVESLHFDTLALHAGQQADPATNARAVPIYQTSSYVFNDSDHAASLFGLKAFGNIYTRIMNPTWAVLEERIAALEGGAAAMATASGQSAETLAVPNIAQSGEHILSSTSLYGGTYNLFHYTLPKMGIQADFVDPGYRDDFRKAITPKTKLIFIDSSSILKDVSRLNVQRPDACPSDKHLGPNGECPGDSDTLLHPAAELMRKGVFESLEPDQAKVSPRPLPALRIGTPWTSRPNSTFPSAVRQGKRSKVWKTISLPLPRQDR